MGRDEDVNMENALATVALGLTPAGPLAAMAQAVGFTTAAQRMDKAIRDSRMEGMEEDIQCLMTKAKAVDAKVADVEAVVIALSEALSHTASPKKRDLLKAAARNAFNKDLYEEGLVLLLLEKMKRLNHVDIMALGEVDNGYSIQLGPNSPIPLHSIKANSYKRLCTEALCLPHGEWKTDRKFELRITELGERMLNFLR